MCASKGAASSCGRACQTPSIMRVVYWHGNPPVAFTHKRWYCNIRDVQQNTRPCAPVVPPIALAPLVAAEQLLAQVPGDRAQVHEVAVAAPRARVLLVLAARRLPEVRDGRELDVDGAPRVEAALQGAKKASEHRQMAQGW